MIGHGFCTEKIAVCFSAVRPHFFTEVCETRQSLLVGSLGRYNAGQNLGIMSVTPQNWTALIELWHSEVADFEFGTGPTSVAPIGHYTQVIY